MLQKRSSGEEVMDCEGRAICVSHELTELQHAKWLRWHKLRHDPWLLPRLLRPLIAHKNYNGVLTTSPLPSCSTLVLRQIISLTRLQCHECTVQCISKE